jgi:chorismate-pyruvate lyase
VSDRVIYKYILLKVSNILATWETKVPERKKQLPTLRNADVRRYNISLKGKDVVVNFENHEIFLPATVC